MVADVIRSVVQRVLRDKILLGLVIVAILGIWVGGMTMSDDKPNDTKKEASEKPAAQTAAGSLNAGLATEFITWWIAQAMDYNPQTATDHHKEAVLWMTQDAGRSFLQTFWTPEIEQSVASGRLVAAFQPTAVQAQAINPDGSVVVGVSGTMVVQSNGQPSTQPFLAAFLVRQEAGGLRVAGMDTRQGGM